MDKELKLLLDNSKLDQLYKHNLFSIKSICEFLGVWDIYSDEDKFKLENFTKRDTTINKHFTYKGAYNTNYTYGEIIRSGVDEIIGKMKNDITVIDTKVKETDGFIVNIKSDVNDIKNEVNNIKTNINDIKNMFEHAEIV